VLNQTATYALRAMAYVARHGRERPVLSQTIAEEMDIPKNFLSKILNRLVQEGLITSTRGSKGGFQPARDPKTITLREAVSPFMNLDAYRNCFLGLSTCDGSCGLHKKWQPIQQRMLKLLDETTVDKVL